MARASTAATNEEMPRERAQNDTAQLAAEARGDAIACPNCGATLADKYCPACGQQRRDQENLTVRRIIGDATREFVDLESGALGTLRDLLFKPGYLTEEFLKGRRQFHVGPAKLYILVSFVFFLVSWDRLMENGGFSNYFAPGGALYPLIERRGLDAEDFFERFNQRFTEYTTWLRFGSVLLSGLLLQLLYLRSRRLFAEHLVFSFHYFSVDFIVNTAYTLLLIVIAAVAHRELPLGASWLLCLGIGPYLFVALRRVYGESATRTALKTVAFIIGQTLIYFLVVIGAMLLAFFLTA